MLLGVSTVLFEGFGNIFFKDIESVKRAGFDFLEISPYHIVTPEAEKFIKSLDMKIFSMHADYLNTDASSPDDALRLKTLRIFKENLENARKIGAEIVVMHPGKWSPDIILKDASLQRCIDTFSEIAAFAFKIGVKIAIENLPPGFICDNVEDLYRILHGIRRNTGNNGIAGICLDTGHANISNNLEMYIRQFGKDIFSMHIHDNHGDTGSNKTFAEDDTHIMPGYGNVNWKNFFKNIVQIEYDNAFIFELMRDNNYEKDIFKVLSGIKEFIKYHEIIS